MDTNNKHAEIELSLFFLREDKNKEPYSRSRQIILLKELSNKPLKEVKDLVDSGRAVITISGQDFEEITRKLEAVGIRYMISWITEKLEEATTLKETPIENSAQEINFIVSKGILNKKKDKTVECYLLSKEEYNKLFAVKATLIDIIGTLKSLVDRCQSIKD